jgi:pyruvate/2-oxoglutarate dehydrogenase complex dihydrolipoamide dehydrogenase (E3) component
LEYQIKTEKMTDIIIYGGTSAGVVAELQAARMNKSVLIIEPGQRIGGLTTGGLGATDIGNKAAIAMDQSSSVQGIAYSKLKDRLQADRQKLIWEQ